MNQVVLVGRLTKNPEVTETENGKKYSSIVLAISRPYKNSDGVYESDFVRCILWNVVAENACEYCHVGDVVGIKGRLKSDSYEDGEGKLKFTLEVVAETLTFLSSKKEEIESS